MKSSRIKIDPHAVADLLIETVQLEAENKRLRAESEDLEVKIRQQMKIEYEPMKKEIAKQVIDKYHASGFNVEKWTGEEWITTTRFDEWVEGVSDG